MKIGIIGCGIAGLATAGLLAADGHDVEILERAPEPMPIGAGLLLQPPGAAILGRMGILDRIRSTSASVTRLDSRSASGRRLIDLDYADLMPQLHGLGIRRPEIWSALFDHALAAGARLLTDVTVTGAWDDGMHACVRSASGEAQSYGLVIVASGTHSSIRLEGVKRRAKLYPWGCLWTTIDLPPSWPLEILQQRCLGTGIMMGILPTGLDGARQTAALYWSMRNDEVDAWRLRPIVDWLTLVERIWPETVPLIRHLKPEDFQHGTYRDVWADPPHSGRILMIGDVAHGTSPQLGQGVTQALRDASSLASCLARSSSVEDSLRHHWEARKRATGYYRLASRLLTPVFQSRIPGLGLARDLCAGWMNDLFRRQALLTLAGMKTGLFGAEPFENVQTISLGRPLLTDFSAASLED